MKEVMNDSSVAREECTCCNRRSLLKAALVGTVGVLAPALAAAARPPDARKLPPQVGDVLAYPSSDFDDRAVLASELARDGAPLLVYPRDPRTGVARERSRLNQILIMRCDPATLDRATAKLAVDGIVAYSGICTHAACGVSEWDATRYALICPCHSSAYDPRARAKVVNGPATRVLPALPLRLLDDKLLVAGPFTAPVGAQTP